MNFGIHLKDQWSLNAIMEAFNTKKLTLDKKPRWKVMEIPLQKLTWQRKITWDTSSNGSHVRCHVGFPGVFHWWINSPWWNFQWWSLPGRWRKWSYARQLLSGRSVSWLGWMWVNVLMKKNHFEKWFLWRCFFWICESLSRLYVLDFVLCNTW